MRITLIGAVLVFYSFIFLSFCNSAFAQASPSGDVDLTFTQNPGAVEIGESLIDPSSPIFFLKALREKIEVSLANSPKAKLTRELEFSLRRLREVKSLVRKNRTDLVPPTIEKYKSHINEANSLAGDDEGLQIQTGETIARHLDVLQRVYDNVGNPRAKQAILSAIVKSEQQNSHRLTKINLEAIQRHTGAAVF